MPYPLEHSARIHSPEGYKSFARKTIAPGIDAIFGIKGGKQKSRHTDSIKQNSLKRKQKHG